MRRVVRMWWECDTDWTQTHISQWETAQYVKEYWSLFKVPFKALCGRLVKPPTAFFCVGSRHTITGYAVEWRKSKITKSSWQNCVSIAYYRPGSNCMIRYASLAQIMQLTDHFAFKVSGFERINAIVSVKYARLYHACINFGFAFYLMQCMCKACANNIRNCLWECA